MARHLPTLWKPALIGLLFFGAAEGLLAPRAVSGEQPSQSGDQSWSSSISSGFKQGVDKLGNMVKPKSTSTPAVDPKDDPVSLKHRGKPGPELNVAVGRLYMDSNRPADAEEQFQGALKMSPGYLPALLAYAQLMDLTDRPDDALRLYREAASLHPMQAPVYNNMGLFYARHGKPDEAIASLGRAVRLDPKNPRYRNNIAMVLVDQGRAREAFEYLCGVHREPVAYYNMGYLLNKKGRTQDALQHFELALRADPNMTQAQRWIEYLHRTTTQARLPQHPMAAGVRVTEDPSLQRTPNYGGRESSAASQALPQRLPPTSGESTGRPTMPGITYEPSNPPDAPMPPPRNPAVRPLPKIE